MKYLWILLLLWAVPAKAQSLAADSLSYEQLTSYLGISFCIDGEYYSFVRQGLSAWEDSAVRVHEAKHRQQYARYPDCASAYRAMMTPTGIMKSEAEAYKAGWCAVRGFDIDTLALLQNYVDRIDRQLGSEVNRMDILNEMKRYKCS